MKNLLKLKNKLSALLALVFIINGLSILGADNYLYAQHTDLLNHTWYFHHATINDAALEKPFPQFESSLIFANFGLYINHTDCYEIRTYDGSYTGTDQFDLTGWAVFPGACNTNAEWDFMFGHYEFFEYNNGVQKNPFTYTISNTGSDYMLVIENGLGDIAEYGTTNLNTDSFSQIAASIYPNPTTGTLFINQSTNRQNLRSNLLTLSGKSVRQQNINSVESEMDLKDLAPGMYFLVLENEEGNRFTHKLIKE